VGEQPTFAEQIGFCKLVFLLQLHFLKLSYSNKIVNYENQGCKFEQGNGAAGKSRGGTPFCRTLKTSFPQEQDFL